MAKFIELRDNDWSLFNEELIPSNYSFYTKHIQTFACMWRDQGQEFWDRFLNVFHHFTMRYGYIQQIDSVRVAYYSMMDFGFKVLEKEVVKGSVHAAKQFISNLSRLGICREKYSGADILLKQKRARTTDPFYMKETRDLYRQFFGEPHDAQSRYRAVLLPGMYLRFGGSLVRCLEEWMHAPPLKPGDVYYHEPEPLHELGIDLSSFSKEPLEKFFCPDCVAVVFDIFLKEKLRGDCHGPRFVPQWSGNPKQIHEDNPLYNPKARHTCNWSDGVDVEQFGLFYGYVMVICSDTHEQCETCVERHRQLMVERLQKKIWGPKDDPPSPEDTSTTTTTKKKKKQKKKKKKKKPSMAASSGDGAKEKEDENNEEDEEEEDEKDKDEDNGEEEDAVGAQGACAAPLLEHFTERSPSRTSDKNPDRARKRPRALSPDLGSMTIAETNGRKSLQENPKTRLEEDKTDKFFTRNAERKCTVIQGLGKAEQYFRIEELKDVTTGCCELTVRLQTKDANEKSTKKKLYPKWPFLKATLEQLYELPYSFEWYEGEGWCAAVFNYEVEEYRSAPKHTNFTLKVSGPVEEVIKNIMVNALVYIMRRKRRETQGWALKEHDVLVFLEHDSINLKEAPSTVITVSTGFDFKERLTEAEKKTLDKSTVGQSHHFNELFTYATLEYQKTKRLKGEEFLHSLKNGDRIGILAETDNCVITQDGTAIHFSDYHPPLFDLRGSQVRENLHIGGIEVDFAHILMERRGEIPLWQQIIDNPENFDFILHAYSTKDDLKNRISLASYSFSESFNAELIKKVFYHEEVSMRCWLRRTCHGDVERYKAGRKDMWHAGTQVEPCWLDGWDPLSIPSKPIATYPDHPESQEWEVDEVNCKGNFAAQVCRQEPGHVYIVVQHRFRTDKLPLQRPRQIYPQSLLTQSLNPLPEPLMQAVATSRSPFRIFPALTETDAGMKKWVTISGNALIFPSPPKDWTEADRQQRRHGVEDDEKCIFMEGVPKSLLMWMFRRSVIAVDQSIRALVPDINGTHDKSELDPSEDLDMLSQWVPLTHKLKPFWKVTPEKQRKTHWECKNLWEPPADLPSTQSLRICFTCGQKEPEPKSFLKCSRCKEEKVVDIRYYCGKECQVKDWKQQHRKEHKDNVLSKHTSK